MFPLINLARKGLNISYGIGRRWISQDLTDD